MFAPDWIHQFTHFEFKRCKIRVGVEWHNCRRMVGRTVLGQHNFMFLLAFVRILAKHLTITRFSHSVARYTMIKHHADVGNPSSPVR